ncbi:MAG: nicotinamide-nucleotide adenylyltransferase [Candidatus Aenigmatarchaeota archaeon]
MSRGLFVGRFQPFHRGHLSTIRRALDEMDSLIIGIGSSEKAYTKTNPFTSEEREEMIRESIEGNYTIKRIPDINEYREWVEHVEKRVGDFDTVYSGSVITIGLFRREGYNIVELDDKKISGTEIRKMLTEDRKEWKKYVPSGTEKVLKDRFGRERVKYLLKNYQKSDVTKTVDGIIEYNGKLVLIERGQKPFKNEMAIPGGHVENGENMEKAVIREMREETGLDFEIEGVLGVYSDPKRDPRGNYITTVFYGRGEGELEAGDDASETHLVDEIPNIMAFDHRKILKDYVEETCGGGRD